MDKKKKIIIGVVIAVVAVAAVVLSIVLAKGGGKKAKDKVYVEKVKTICDNDAGTTNRFSGVVEAQDSWMAIKRSKRYLSKSEMRSRKEISSFPMIWTRQIHRSSRQISN